MCLIFNVIILLAYAGEMWIDYGVILDEDAKLKEKRVYIVRLVLITFLAYMALMILYKSFGVNDANLIYYIKYNQIR